MNRKSRRKNSRRRKTGVEIRSRTSRLIFIAVAILIAIAFIVARSG